MTVAKAVDPELDKALGLDVLAAKANELHHAAESLARGAIERAREAGGYLVEAKALCKHGEWLGWLEGNFEGSKRTAQAYMRVSLQWKQIEAKSADSAHLTVQSALELLNEKSVEVEPDEILAPQKEGQWSPPFREPRLLASFMAHELSYDTALMLDDINQRGMVQTYEALWEHDHADAKVRRSEAQLRHLLEQNAKGQTDAQVAELVERTENSESSSVYEVHRVRQEERREEVRQQSTFDKLDESDQAFIEQFSSTYLSGYGGDESREKISRDVQRFSENRDDWGDLSFDEKQSIMLEHFGKKQAKSYEKTPVKKEAVQRLSGAEVQSLEVACSNLIALAHSTKALSSGDKGEVRKSLEHVNAVAERMLS